MDRNCLLRLDAALEKVATREGGVDRNQVADGNFSAILPSPPARVAWIEILCEWRTYQAGEVATREGGVDRNFEDERAYKAKLRRHPRGWRG